jgi:hypothetical protein
MSDVIKTVVALQGNPVKREILGAVQDGYVLTWTNADNEWESKPTAHASAMYNQTFTADGYWTAPAGVHTVNISAFGGGGGGGGSNGGYQSAGGGSLLQNGIISVIPGNSYYIFIGPGGLGDNTGTTNGGDGYTTSFGTLFYAIGGSGSGSNFAGTPALGSGPGYTGFANIIGQSNGYSNSGYGSFAGGTTFVSVNGGIGGGAGPNGNGGNGGANNTSPGVSAAANSGAGGGSAGQASSGTLVGGNGGSGMLIVSWVA